MAFDEAKLTDAPLPIPPALMGQMEPDYERLADAIYQAEGGARAKVPYGILSVKVKDEAEARRVAINTARNNFKRWEKAGKPGTYIEFLANRYVPPTADPRGNKNWKVNVPKIYSASEPKPKVVLPAYSVTNLPPYGVR